MASDGTNLIGLPLNQTTINQMEARLALETQQVRSDETLTWMANNNSWIKLTSSINIGGSNATAAGGVLTSVPRKVMKDVTLGGVSEYTVGGLSELGFRPPPGIISATISTQGKGGSLRIAEVKIRANNLEQLNNISRLYFKLGYSCLLEWGHSVYAFDSGNNRPVELRQNLGTINFLQANSKETVLTQIRNRRVSSQGNYDGLLGLISNYNWQTAADGSYECTIKLTGIGSIIDSLKVNSASNFPLITSYAPSFLLQGFYSAQRAAQGFNPPPPAVAQPPAVVSAPKAASALEEFLTQIKGQADAALPSGSLVPQVCTIGNGGAPTMNQLFQNGLELWPDPATGVSTSDAFQRGYLTGGTQNNFIRLGDILTVPVTANGTTTRQFYMKLGLLLAYINNSCLMYNSLGGIATVEPMVKVNFNIDGNYCYRSTSQFSIDPNICVVNSDFSDQAQFDSLIALTDLVPSDLDTGSYFDPGTSMLSNTGGPYPLSDFSQYCTTRNGIETGRIMEIGVNIDFAITTLRSLEGTTSQNVNLLPYLTQLMGGIQGALGNINSFRVAYDDDTNTVTIYDDQLLRRDTYTQLPIYGLNSVFKSYGIRTDASTKIGSTLAISAMANTTGTKPGINEDVSALLRRSEGFEDRVMPKKTIEVKPASKSNKPGANSFGKFLSQYYGPVPPPAVYDTQLLTGAGNYYKLALSLEKAEGLGNSITANAVLPISFEGTLPGLSTFILYEGFTVPPNRLPSEYKDSNGRPVVGFLLTGITDTIEGSTWTTSIKAAMFNLPRAGSRAVKPPPAPKPKEAKAGGSFEQQLQQAIKAVNN
jgi:hypothetical protein